MKEMLALQLQNLKNSRNGVTMVNRQKILIVDDDNNIEVSLVTFFSKKVTKN